MRGTLVCFEGLDNSGKTTIIQKLSELLIIDELKVKIFTFPNKVCLTWNLIESYQFEFVDLHPKTSHLLYSANRWEAQTEILSLLDQGYIVLLDRYFYSGIAYSCGHGDIDFSWACHVESGLIVPDIVFYVETPEDTRMQRHKLEKTRSRCDSIQSQRKIEIVYNKLRTDSWVVLSGIDSLDNICNTISIKLKPFLNM